MFLYDEDATPHSLSLNELGDILRNTFTDEKLELVGLHGCSLSGLEVACELQGKAKFMIASQGTQYVGHWPYREILIRIFNDVIKSRTSPDEIKDTIENIYAYILRSSYDFQMAGISSDLTLCNLEGVQNISDPLRGLSEKLSRGLRLTRTKDGQEEKDEQEENDPFIQERVLLAHWDAQSYFEENYTDLYDFCLCLARRLGNAVPPSEAPGSCATNYRSVRDLIYVLERKENIRLELTNLTSDRSSSRNLQGPNINTLMVCRSTFPGRHRLTKSFGPRSIRSTNLINPGLPAAGFSF